MNAQLKTVLLTILTLSVFVIALVELSGVSKTALIHQWNGDDAHAHHQADMKAASEYPKTTIQFEETKHHFGTIREGEKVKFAYKFTNTGENPLVITNAVASCGCTVPSYPKEPVAPGRTGEIVVEFNSAGRPGHQQKNVMIYSNAQQEAMSLGFEGEVSSR